jgi:predicted transcriptional regulator of viral defense system
MGLDLIRTRSSAARFRALVELSASQDGYFTTAQAREAGWSRRALAHHAKTGLLVRVGRGLYRLAGIPEPPFGDVVAAWLLVGPHHAVVSHWTAVEVLGLVPTRSHEVHLTVPRDRRPRSAPPLPWIRVHSSSRPFGPRDVVRRGPLPVTSPARTIADLAEQGDLGTVYAAVREALRVSPVSYRDILEAVRDRRRIVRVMVEDVLLRTLSDRSVIP